MSTNRSVRVKDIVEKFQMEVINKGTDYDTEILTITDVNRPGLQFIGFFDYFDPRRLQIIGKSETAIELIKRGHRLVADDAVEIKRIGATLVGTAPELIRNYLEVRGVGVIDVEKLFGVGSVQDSTQIDLVIQFEKWADDKFYDRLGLDENDTTILDVPVPQITIPVSAGRNLAAIVELAAMNNRQKKHGFNSAREFAAQIDGHIDRVTRENGLKNQKP